MKGTKITGLNLDAFAKDLMKVYIQEQNNRLIQYAKETIVEIGNTIKTYQSKHNMDRTGNLLNSLCWGVSYKGKLLDSGFYREETLRDKGIAGTSESYLHEWSHVSFIDKYDGSWAEDINADEPVNGRQLAEDYILKSGGGGSRGWKVFFAILAPYWGYWEEGFTLIHGFSRNSARTFYGATHKRFAVMAQFYDKVRKDLKPAKKYYFHVSVPKYTSLSLLKRAQKTYYS